MNGKVGTYEFQVEPFHTDVTGRLSLPFLGNHLLNVAGRHASERGFGMATVQQDHYTWVLSRLVIEMPENLPAQYEPFHVETWVESVYRQFTDRSFMVTDQNGRPCAYARSVWAMISQSGRLPLDLSLLHGDGIKEYVLERECPIKKFSHVVTKDWILECSRKVQYSDIDVNGHVNSIQYMTHVLDLFPLDFFRQKRLSRFEIGYVQEAFYGQTLDYFLDKTPDMLENAYQVDIREHESGQSICRGKVFFCGIESLT